MVAHTRKTPGAGPLRPVKLKAVKLEGAKPIAPGAVNQEAQGLQFRSLNLPVHIEVVEGGMERPVSVTLPPASSSRPAQTGRTSTAASLAVTAINDLWQVDDSWPKVWIPKRCSRVLLTHDRGSNPMESAPRKAASPVASLGTLVARPPLAVTAAT